MESDRLLGRNGAIWVAYCRGKTQEALAQEHGLSQARVSQIIREVRDSIPELDRAEEIQRSLDLLHQLRHGALAIWDQAAAPVTSGKDGDVVYDPETNEVVRDHSGRLQAAQYALKVDQEVRKLLGLDAAQKMDLNVNQAEEERAEQLARDAARRLAGTDDTKELDSNGDR